MIIKSLSRKGIVTPSGVKTSRGQSPFATLIRYMNRGIEKEDGQAILWHNFYGGDFSREEDILQEFEANATLLKERKNGNVLYHEILSFSAGNTLTKEELAHILADIGNAYLQDRAPRQIAYGVIHRDTDHVHLHLMISANAFGKSDRVRLSKKEFATIQKNLEYFTLERYKALAQTPIYSKDRQKEKMKSTVHEQAMKLRSGTPSKKEQVKMKLHQIFEQAQTPEELIRLLQKEGIQFYTRGKNTGVIVKESDGTEKRHRLETLGVSEHYARMNEKIFVSRSHQSKQKEQAMKIPKMPQDIPEHTFPERKPSTAEILASEFITGKLHPEWHPSAQEKEREEKYTDPILQAMRQKEKNPVQEKIQEQKEKYTGRDR